MLGYIKKMINNNQTIILSVLALVIVIVGALAFNRRQRFSTSNVRSVQPIRAVFGRDMINKYGDGSGIWTKEAITKMCKAGCPQRPELCKKRMSDSECVQRCVGCNIGSCLNSDDNCCPDNNCGVVKYGYDYGCPRRPHICV